MNEKLLSCPFCGGEAKYTPMIINGADLTLSEGFVKCASCGASTGSIRMYSKAIAAWNRRVADMNVGSITRCADCESWDKSISFMGAHACAHWSPSRKEPRYTEWFEFCSFARSESKEEPAAEGADLRALEDLMAGNKVVFDVV